jgi:hypothetical protein
MEFLGWFGGVAAVTPPNLMMVIEPKHVGAVLM